MSKSLTDLHLSGKSSRLMGYTDHVCCNFLLRVWLPQADLTRLEKPCNFATVNHNRGIGVAACVVLCSPANGVIAPHHEQRCDNGRPRDGTQPAGGHDARPRATAGRLPTSPADAAVAAGLGAGLAGYPAALSRVDAGSVLADHLHRRDGRGAGRAVFDAVQDRICAIICHSLRCRRCCGGSWRPWCRRPARPSPMPRASSDRCGCRSSSSRCGP